MSTTLNMTLKLRRAKFKNACVLLEGEPGFHTETKVLKIGDGSTPWAELPFANEAQIKELIKAVDDKVKALDDTFATDAYVEEIRKALADAIDLKLDKTAYNAYVEAHQSDYTNTQIDAKFNPYRTSSDQDAIDATFETIANVDLVRADVTNITKEGGLIDDAKSAVIGTADDTKNSDTIYGAKAYAKDLVDKIPAPTDYTVTCEDEDVVATDSTPAFKRHVLKQLDGTVCTIDVPKDMVIADGRVEGDKLILKLNTGTEIEIDVADLIEYVTGDTANDGVITVSVDPTTHVVTAKINDKTITADKFASDVDTYVDGRVDDKIAELDVSDISGFGAGKTLATLTETDGKIAATFQDIAITKSQITDFVESDYKKVQTPVPAPTTDGTALEFVDSISQDAQGVITATKKSVDLGNYYSKTEADAKFVETIEIATGDTDGSIKYTIDDAAKGDVKVAGWDALVSRVASVEQSGVKKITAGNDDIVVTPAEGTGNVEIAHKDYGTGTLSKDPATLETGDAYVFTGLDLENGHVTGGAMKSLADILGSIKFIFDGGTSAN